MGYTEKYVRSDAAGGGDGTTNTNSGANGAYTLAEAITHSASNTGVRYNIRSGTYTLSADLTIPAAATEAPNAWQGFQTSIADLESVGRASASADLTITNFPLIDGVSTYKIVSVGSFNILRNLNVKTGANVTVVTIATSATNVLIHRCRIESTHTTGTSVRIISGSSTSQTVTDCDLVVATNGAVTSIVSNRGTVCHCKIWNTHASPSSTSFGLGVSDIGSVAVGNIIYNFGTGLDIGSAAMGAIGNSIYKVVNGCRLGGNGAIVADNVFQSLTGYLFTGVASSGNPLIMNNASTTPTSGRMDTGTLGSIIAELNAISLSGNPFTDATTGDFTLNNTAGAGADCRAASKFFGGKRDLGAVQHTDSGGSTQSASGFIF
jgi:hypothetical protein